MCVWLALRSVRCSAVSCTLVLLLLVPPQPAGLGLGSWRLAAGRLDGVMFCRRVDAAHVVTVEQRLPCHSAVAGKVDQLFPSYCHRPLLLTLVWDCVTSLRSLRGLLHHSNLRACWLGYRTSQPGTRLVFSLIHLGLCFVHCDQLEPFGAYQSEPQASYYSGPGAVRRHLVIVCLAVRLAAA